MLSESYSKTETGTTDIIELPENNDISTNGNEILSNQTNEIENGEEIYSENYRTNFTDIPAMPIFTVTPKLPVFVPPMPIFSASKIGVSATTETEYTETENLGQDIPENSTSVNAIDIAEMEKKEVKVNSFI